MTAKKRRKSKRIPSSVMKELISMAAKKKRVSASKYGSAYALYGIKQRPESSHPTWLEWAATDISGYDPSEGHVNVTRLIVDIKNKIINTKKELSYLKRLEKNVKEVKSFQAKHKTTR